MAGDLAAGQRIADIRRRQRLAGGWHNPRALLETTRCQREVGGDAHVVASDALGDPVIRRIGGVFRIFHREKAEEIACAKLADMGIKVRDAEQAVGTMSGGERQCLAIARAIHFGARVLILDEPTAALGVRQSANVLRLIARAREKGISVIFITHNVHHAYPVGDSFTLLNRGRSMGTFRKGEIQRDQVLDMMAGGLEMQKLMAEFGVRV